MKLEQCSDGLHLLPLRQVTDDEELGELVESVDDYRDEGQHDERADADRRAADL